MAWNVRQKITPAERTEVKVTSGTSATLGSNVAYSGAWDNKRAVGEALQRVTWVYRAVDAIASNAARLPIILREGDPIDGMPVENFSLYKLLNSTPNAGEDSVAFRYRLSAQLVLSDNGVFIEVTRNRRGEILALTLLPPHAVTPIADVRKFVSGFHFEMDVQEANGTSRRISKKYKTQDIIWIRKPHPFNPYGAITPLPAAGVAIETDWLAKMYNRNFLLNDGRPGGMIVVKGEMMEEDKNELRAKFGGSINRAGRISVIASEDGADFVDTAVSPRDAQYIDGRKVNKEEILMAFGVPESVIANAGGKTFDNAEMERLVFWMETMIPHMDMVTRPLDALDPNPNTFISYSLEHVDVLQRMKMKRHEFHLREMDAGGTSQNEYRQQTGRDPINNPRADVLYIAKSKFPTVTTDGETPEAIDFNPDGTQLEGRPQGGVVEEPEDEPNEREDDRLGEMDNTDTTPAGQATAEVDIAAKIEDFDIWNEVANATLEKLLSRAGRVLMEKSSGSKFRRAFFNSELSDSEVVSEIVDSEVWSKQCFEDFSPVAKGIVSNINDDLSGEIGTVRVYNIPAKIHKAVESVVEVERSKSKPDMASIPAKIQDAVQAILSSSESRTAMRDFVGFYGDLASV